jgi:hypothetical protein
LRYWTDCWGARIRITDERMRHALEHPEMRGQETHVEETLAAPEAVVQSRSDPDVRLYYRVYETEEVGRKYLCAVVKWRTDDPFLITAHFTDRMKRGSHLWPSP